MHSTRCGGQRGFSLIEVVVALAVLSLSLGVLYQAAGGASRNVRTDERYAYAVELARSLLADNGSVPRRGVDTQGKTNGGFAWTVTSSPVNAGDGKLPSGALQSLKISVSWQDGRQQRSVVLDSVVPGIPEK